MRQAMLLTVLAIATGCAPRQDPGIPIPKSASSGVAALSVADAAVAQQADTLSAIDAAKRVVAENMSNAETIGYKAICCRVQNGKSEVYLNFEQGPLEMTNRQLDVAISGPGFFRVKTCPDAGDGVAYTRNGNFFLNRNGEMVLGAGDGYRLDPPITLPNDSTDISISQDGVVAVVRAGSTEKQVVGQVNLYQFVDPQHLLREVTLLRRGPLCGEAIESKPHENKSGYLQQNFLEGSNVDINREKLRAEYLDHWRTAVAMR